MTTDDKIPTPGAEGKKSAKSYPVTVRVLQRLEELSLDTTPQFYELWFRYFTGEPDIVRAVEGLKEPPDAATCQKIYNRYLGNSAHAEAITNVSGHVQQSITELDAVLKSVASNTSEYGASLSAGNKEIQSATSIEQLGAIMSGISQETRKMYEKNQQLQGQLDNSSKEISQLKDYLESARREASTDGLTGVANRKAFDRKISDGIEEASAAKAPLVLMMLDIDHFKKFNDTYGHPVGDLVLRLVARTLVGNVKGDDLVARYGGEEFAVILPNTPLASGLRVAESLRRSIESKDITNKATGEKLGSITISVGIADYHHGDDVVTLIEQADQALYEAKKTGRNKVCVANRAGG